VRRNVDDAQPAHVASKIASRRTGVELLEDGDDLRFGETALSHVSLPAGPYARDLTVSACPNLPPHVTMSRASLRPDLRRARKTVEWLSEKWDVLTVCERAEALRLLVHRVTYETWADAQPMRITILSSGSAFDDSAGSFSALSRKLVETA
jgi:hypothetical protein